METLEICKHNLCGFFNTANQLQICDNDDFTLDTIYKERLLSFKKSCHV